MKSLRKHTSIEVKSKKCLTGTLSTISCRGKTFGSIGSAIVRRSGKNKSSLILETNLYHKSQNYSPLHVELNNKGKLVAALEETEGVMPSLISDSQDRLWTVFTSMPEEKQVIAPFESRKAFAVEKPFEFHKTRFIGAIEDSLFFENQKGGLRRVEIIEDGKRIQTTRSKTIRKDPALKKGRFVIRDNQLVFETLQSDFWVGVNGKVEQKKKLEPSSRQPDLIQKGNRLEYRGFDSKGKPVKKVIALLPKGRSLFGVTAKVSPGPNEMVCSIVFDGGNGWAHVREGDVVSSYLQVADGTYRESQSHEEIEIPAERRLVLSTLNLMGNQLAVTFYEQQRLNRRERLFALILPMDSGSRASTKSKKPTKKKAVAKKVVAKKAKKTREVKLPPKKKTMHNTTFAIQYEGKEKDLVSDLGKIYREKFSKSTSKFFLDSYLPRSYKYVWVATNRRSGLFVELVPNADKKGVLFKSRHKSSNWILNVRVNFEYVPKKDPLEYALDLEKQVLESALWKAKAIAHPK